MYDTYPYVGKNITGEYRSTTCCKSIGFIKRQKQKKKYKRKRKQEDR
jgi:hypothetical protein